MTVSTIGILALALLGIWIFGGIALRLASVLIALAGLLGLSLAGNASGVLVFALGACLWLAGHLHFRLRHGAFKSALAERLCLSAASASRRTLAIAISDRRRGSGVERCGQRGGGQQVPRALRHEPGRGDWRKIEVESPFECANGWTTYRCRQTGAPRKRRWYRQSRFSPRF